MIILTAFPSSLKNAVLDILTISLQSLQILSPLFYEYYLSSDDTSPASDQNEHATLPQLAATVLDFMSSCSRVNIAKSWFSDVNNINACIKTTFVWTQITRDDVCFSYKLS
jgi:hypothetical protein